MISKTKKNSTIKTEKITKAKLVLKKDNTEKSVIAKKKSIPKKTNLENELIGLGLKEKKVSKKKPLIEDSERKKVIKLIVTELADKKCEEVVVIDLEKVNSYLSVFIICTVSSSVQAKSVVRELERKTKHLKLGTGSIEKKNSPSESGWSILDLGEIIVHVMTKEIRNYYDLDKLWGDAEKIKV